MKVFTVFARLSSLVEVRVAAASKADALARAKDGEGTYGVHVSRQKARYYPTIKEAEKGAKKAVANSE